MKRKSKRLSLCVFILFALANITVGSTVLADESNFQTVNTPAVVLATAGIAQTDAVQLGGLQGIIADLISSGQVTIQQAQNIVQYHINNAPRVVQEGIDVQSNTTVPYQALKEKYEKYSVDPSNIMPMHIRSYGGSYYEAVTYSNNPYAPGHGFQQAAGYAVLPSTVTVASVNNQQNDHPYISFGMFQNTAGGFGCEAGLMYEMDVSGNGAWHPFIFSFSPGYNDQLMVDTGTSIYQSSTSTVYMAVLLEKVGSSKYIRLVVYDLTVGGVLVDDLYTVRNMASYVVGGSSYIMFRTTGMMRYNDSASIMGGYVATVQWSGALVGSFDSQGDTLGLGTWDTIRGNLDNVSDGNVPGAVYVFAKTPYSGESVIIAY
jgi:hypothetical protein